MTKSYDLRSAADCILSWVQVVTQKNLEATRHSLRNFMILMPNFHHFFLQEGPAEWSIIRGHLIRTARLL